MLKSGFRLITLLEIGFISLICRYCNYMQKRQMIQDLLLYEPAESVSFPILPRPSFGSLPGSLPDFPELHGSPLALSRAPRPGFTCLFSLFDIYTSNFRHGLILLVLSHFLAFIQVIFTFRLLLLCLFLKRYP